MTRTITTSDSLETPGHGAIGTRLGAILVSHTAVDVYSAFVPPLIGVLQVRCHLEESQAAWLYGVGSLSSGLSQPIGAWISDHTDSRLFGALGLLLSAVCLSCIGMADSFATLLPLYILGMIGVGIFHPVGASCTGQLAEQMPGKRRSLWISIFFVFGMAGGFSGSMIARWVAANGDVGFDLLRYALIPGVLIAMVLHMVIRKVPHRHHAHHLIQFKEGDLKQRWQMMSLLYVASALRFTVNVTLFFLMVQWAESYIATGNPLLGAKEVAEQGGAIAATLIGMSIVGMAIGGLAAGTIIPKGSEKWPLVIVPIAFAPCIALFAVIPLWACYILAVVIGIGFASMIPVSLGLAQRLLPHKTSLASGLMLGGAWAMAFVGPRSAVYCQENLDISLAGTFAIVAGMLAMSGLVCLLLNGKALHETVNNDPH